MADETYFFERDTSDGRNILTDVFNNIHHPDTPVQAEIYMTVKSELHPDDPLKRCESIYMTRYTLLIHGCLKWKYYLVNGVTHSTF